MHEEINYNGGKDIENVQSIRNEISDLLVN